MRKKILLSVLTLLLFLTACGKKEGSYTVGVLQWANHPALDISYEVMKDKLEGLDLDGEIVLKHEVAHEDMGQAMMITQQFIQDGVDLIYTIATSAAQAAKKLTESKGVPMVFAAVSDPLAAGLLMDDDKPEGLITGTSDLPPLEKQLELILEILPDLETLGLIYNMGEINSAEQVRNASNLMENFNKKTKLVGISSSSELASASAQVVKESDAIFVVNDNMIVSGLSLLISIANQEKVPVFVAEESPFDQGVLASESISYQELAEKSAIMIYDILIKQKQIVDIPVERSETTNLIFSEKVAESLDIVFPDSVLNRGVSR